MFNIINYISIKNNIHYYNIDEDDIKNNTEILDLIYENSFKEKLVKLFSVIKSDGFRKLPESEKYKFKIAIGTISEKIFTSFFTKEIDLSKFDARIKAILSRNQQTRIME